MNKSVKTIGLTALAIGALVYPAMMLYRARTAKKAQAKEEDDHVTKAFAPSYLTNHKPHHRKETDHLHQ